MTSKMSCQQMVVINIYADGLIVSPSVNVSTECHIQQEKKKKNYSIADLECYYEVIIMQ
jgi:hypothetical protein